MFHTCRRQGKIKTERARGRHAERRQLSGQRILCSARSQLLPSQRRGVCEKGTAVQTWESGLKRCEMCWISVSLLQVNGKILYRCSRVLARLVFNRFSLRGIWFQIVGNYETLALAEILIPSGVLEHPGKGRGALKKSQSKAASQANCTCVPAGGTLDKPSRGFDLEQPRLRTTKGGSSSPVLTLYYQTAGPRTAS